MEVSRNLLSMQSFLRQSQEASIRQNMNLVTFSPMCKVLRGKEIFSLTHVFQFNITDMKRCYVFKYCLLNLTISNDLTVSINVRTEKKDLM